MERDRCAGFRRLIAAQFGSRNGPQRRVEQLSNRSADQPAAGSRSLTGAALPPLPRSVAVAQPSTYIAPSIASIVGCNRCRAPNHANSSVQTSLQSQPQHPQRRPLESSQPASASSTPVASPGQSTADSAQPIYGADSSPASERHGFCSPRHSLPSAWEGCTRWSPATAKQSSPPISLAPREQRVMPFFSASSSPRRIPPAYSLLERSLLYASRYIVPEQLYPWLGALSGITIAGLGCYMLLRRLTGTATDHSHAPGAISWPLDVLEAPADEESRIAMPVRSNTAPAQSVSLTQLFTLGITGGIIPCPAALIVLLSAFALHRIGLGFFLIVAFSIGLAAVLIGFGMLMVYARRFMTHLQVDGPLTRRWLPVASSAFITVLGLILDSSGPFRRALRRAPAFQRETWARLVRYRSGPDPRNAAFYRCRSRGCHFNHRQQAAEHPQCRVHRVRLGNGSHHHDLHRRLVDHSLRSRDSAPSGVIHGVQRRRHAYSARRPEPYRRDAEDDNLLHSGSCPAQLKRLPRSAGKQHNEIGKAGSRSSVGRFGLYQCLRPLVIGLVHGLAGSAAVALLVLSTIHNPVWATVYLLIFGAGTMIGMMCMTAAIAVPLTFAGDRFSAVSQYLGVASGMVSLCFGSFLVYQLGFLGGLFTGHPQWTPQ